MDPRLEVMLATDAGDLDARWHRLAEWIGTRFGRDLTLEAVLFLIGVQESGHGFSPQLEKDAKQDLIMEGTYSAFEAVGIYERVGADEEGRWVWQRVIPFPALDVDSQEKLLRLAVLAYFDPVLADLT
jgi:hypothetical protein